MNNSTLKNITPYLLLGQNIIQLLCFVAFLLAAFFLSFPSYYLNLFFFIWMILNAVDIVTRGKFSIEKPAKNNIHLYLLIISYVWMIISLLWSDNLAEGNKLLFRRIPFLIFPLFALMGFNKFFRLKIIMLVFILGSICSIIALTISGILFYQEHSDFFHNDSSLFFQHVIGLYKHRTYLSLCLIFSLIFFTYLKKDIVQRISPAFYYIFFLVMYALFFFVIYISQSRMSLIILMMVSAVFVISFLWNKGFKKLIILFVCLFLVGFFLLANNHPRMENLELSKEKLQQFDPRYELWRNTIQCIEESNKLTGVGIGDCEDIFVKNHQKPEFQQYYSDVTNPHNEFLKTQLELGLIGNLLLLAIFTAMLSFNKTGRLTILNITILWFLFMLIETIGITSPTVYMFSFSLLLIYMIKSGKESKENEFKLLINQFNQK